jgi:hypothetical protein
VIVIGAGGGAGSFWIGIAIAAAIFGLFGAFGYGVWRMVDPSRWTERDTGQMTPLSLGDQVRATALWTLIAGAAVLGLPGAVTYAANADNEYRVLAVLVGVAIVVFIGLAIGAWTIRCEQTGKRVFLCPCPRHSGE